MWADESRIISLHRGLLGFPNYTKYAIIQVGGESIFLWLQSTEEPELAFVVTDPSAFFADYSVCVDEDTKSELGWEASDEPVLLVVCNQADGRTTANMVGPIVINPRTRSAVQVVLTGHKWTTREQLLAA